MIVAAGLTVKRRRVKFASEQRFFAAGVYLVCFRALGFIRNFDKISLLSAFAGRTLAGIW